MTNDVAIQVQGVGKKYCRSLRRTLVYGVQDVARDVFGIAPKSEDLRLDEFWALNDVSFEVKRGECLGLIGANGAGKSTLLKLLNGVILPDKGTIRVHGRVRGLLELGAGFHPMLTGRENIHLSGAVLGLSKKEMEKRFDEIVDFASLWEFIDTPVKYYSSGMYRQVRIFGRDTFGARYLCLSTKRWQWVMFYFKRNVSRKSGSLRKEEQQSSS